MQKYKSQSAVVGGMAALVRCNGAAKEKQGKRSKAWNISRLAILPWIACPQLGDEILRVSSRNLAELPLHQLLIVDEQGHDVQEKTVMHVDNADDLQRNDK